jgi:hypothetical protein
VPGIWLVNSRGAARRHAREGDKKNAGDRAVIGDLINFAGPLKECLPRAVRLDLALAANRFVNGDRSLLDDDNCAPGWECQPEEPPGSTLSCTMTMSVPN